MQIQNKMMVVVITTVLQELENNIELDIKSEKEKIKSKTKIEEIFMIFI